MPLLSHIEQIGREVWFTSATRLAVRGTDVPLPDRMAQAVAAPSQWTRAAAELLARLLYDVYYLGLPLRPDRFTSTNARVRVVEQHGHPVFTRLLSDANAGCGWLSEGWRVVRQSAAGWRVSEGEVTLTAREHELVPCNGGTLAPGEFVSVRFPKDMLYASPGYYFAVSDAGPPHAAVRPACRIYMNVRAKAAPLVLRRVTALLCDRRARASVKVLNHPDAFVRPDALVILLERDVFLELRSELEVLFMAVSRHLDAGVPAFTKRWMPGVAIGEEPPGQGLSPRSFGEHRTRLIATGIAQAHVSDDSVVPPTGSSNPDQRVAAVLRVLRGTGLDPEQLHLNPGSADVYPGSPHPNDARTSNDARGSAAP